MLEPKGQGLNQAEELGWKKKLLSLLVPDEKFRFYRGMFVF